MPSTEESFEHIGDVRIGRYWVPLGKFVAGMFSVVLLIIGLSFLILWNVGTKRVTSPLCPKLDSFSLRENESKAFTLKDGSAAVVTMTSADPNGGIGTLKVGEQTTLVRFSSGGIEDWYDFRVGMIGSTTVLGRSSLKLVASDCSKLSGLN
jgi:hypothetical protein